MGKAKQKIEYGDWQTPTALAEEVCSVLSSQELKPASVIEPALGKGAFLIAALKFFPTLAHAVGIEINESHVKIAQEAVSKIKTSCKIELLRANFFDVNWMEIVRQLPEPILIIGNPPWVTNAGLTALGSTNLPHKSNFQNLRGIEALTGKSNFDISEWMLLQTFSWMENREVTLAMLCKTVVARKLLLKAWQNNRNIKTSSIYHIDAMTHFGASVDACLLIIPASSCTKSTDCLIYNSLSEKKPSNAIGYKQNRLVSNVEVFEQHKHLLNDENHSEYVWRSGIKHDCANVMELKEEQKGFYRNGLDEIFELEEDFLYPMLKSSDVAKGPPFDFSKKLLVTQHHVSENTSYIRHMAPETWDYLNKHAMLLNRRASSIYRRRPQFSIFGVGDYTFTPWKVAISGFYKFLNFAVVGPFEGKPVVFDDTCCFISCQNEDEAACLAEILNSQPAKNFLSSLIFWDAKRPITMDLLYSLNIDALAQELDLYAKLHKHNASLQLSFFK